MPKTVMALVPHPDDAEYSAGGLLAKFADEGAAVILVTTTDGRRGSFEIEPDELALVRAEEARQAAKVLGAEPPILLNHPDFEIDRLPAGMLREQFIRLIRVYKPDVVVAEDPYSVDEPHPDHRAVAWAAYDAVTYASLPLIHPEHRDEGLEPHLVAEKYYYTGNPARVNRIVNISATMEKKLAALAQHKSQICFLVESISRQARQAGLDLEAVLGDATQNPMESFAWAMQSQAAEVGRPEGYTFGEAYHYERYHPIVENLLIAD